MSSTRIQDMAETCTTTGNPALYCLEPEVTTPNTFSNYRQQQQQQQQQQHPTVHDNFQKSNFNQLQQQQHNAPISNGPPPVEQEPVHARAPERPDAATFDIVKATQYGAIERVRELVRYLMLVANLG